MYYAHQAIRWVSFLTQNQIQPFLEDLITQGLHCFAFTGPEVRHAFKFDLVILGVYLVLNTNNLTNTYAGRGSYSDIVELPMFITGS